MTSIVQMERANKCLSTSYFLLILYSLSFLFSYTASLITMDTLKSLGEIVGNIKAKGMKEWPWGM